MLMLMRTCVCSCQVGLTWSEVPLAAGGAEGGGGGGGGSATPGPRAHHAVAALGSSLFLFGGEARLSRETLDAMHHARRGKLGEATPMLPPLHQRSEVSLTSSASLPSIRSFASMASSVTGSHLSASGLFPGGSGGGGSYGMLRSPSRDRISRGQLTSSRGGGGLSPGRGRGMSRPASRVLLPTRPVDAAASSRPATSLLAPAPGTAAAAAAAEAGGGGAAAALEQMSAGLNATSSLYSSEAMMGTRPRPRSRPARKEAAPIAMRLSVDEVTLRPTLTLAPIPTPIPTLTLAPTLTPPETSS